MAEEKPGNAPATRVSDGDDHDREPVADLTRPKGWKYKELKIAGVSLSWYASPSFQLVLVSFVCFMCPGMFNALSSLGGGGKTDKTTADNMVRLPLYALIYIYRERERTN